MSLVFACSKKDTVVGPGGNDSIDVFHVFYGTAYDVYSVKMDWAPDGSFLVFAGGPSGNIWRVPAAENSIPIQVTDISSDGNKDGGYTPSYLNDGRIAYYVGWLLNDKTMHIMAAAKDQVKNSPDPSTLLSFNGSQVGLGLYSASSPNELTVSGDGLRAVGQWNEIYTLDWNSLPLASVNLSSVIGAASSLMISRDGAKIVYQSAGEIRWIPFGGGASHLVGKGTYPSWNGDGSLLGYIGETGNYIVYDLNTGQIKTYRFPDSGIHQYPVLSRDGKKIAFRRFGTTESGISVGILDN